MFETTGQAASPTIDREELQALEATAENPVGGSAERDGKGEGSLKGRQTRAAGASRTRTGEEKEEYDGAISFFLSLPSVFSLYFLIFVSWG
jgi:hypothetical protein